MTNYKRIFNDIYGKITFTSILYTTLLKKINYFISNQVFLQISYKYYWF